MPFMIKNPKQRREKIAYPGKNVYLKNTFQNISLTTNHKISIQ